MELVVDGDVVTTVFESPFDVKWDTREIANGRHRLDVRLRNAAGETLASAARNVVIDNSMTAMNRIRTDYHAGVLDRGTYLRYLIERLENPAVLPLRYRPGR